MTNTILRNIFYSRCTIVSDGWSNVQRRPLIDVMVVRPRGKTFINTIDKFGAIKSGAYIADTLVIIIDEVGPNHVVQVMMENAKNCKNVSALITRQILHV